MNTFDLLLGITHEYLKRQPDYNQKKKERFYKLESEYQKENRKRYPHRDDERVVILRDELQLFLKVFYSEIRA